MAAAAIAEAPLLRCPACMKLLRVPAETRETANILCAGCKGKFVRRNAIPVAEPQARRPGPEPPLALPAPAPSGFFKYSGPIAAVAGCYATGTFIGLRMKGPQFLTYFIGVFVVTFVAPLLLAMGSDRFKRAPWLGFLVFEGIGVTRIITGMQQGMHEFVVLLLLMAIGGILFLGTQASRESGSQCSVGGCGSGSGSWWSCGGGGGCGGGEGCGGCGD